MGSSPRRIGFFDSGRGGLSIAEEVQRQMSGLELVYLPDTAGFPYSSKSGEYIQNRVVWGVDRLVGEGCEAIILACNTATLYAVEAAREHSPDTPIVGTVPALKPAIESDAEHIWLLVTQSAAQSEKLRSFVASFQQPERVTILGLTALVEAIESGETEAIRELLSGLVKQYNFESSAVVLGCTHFPLALEQFSEIFPSTSHFFSPTQGVVDQLKRVLSQSEAVVEPTTIRFIS